MSVERLPKAIRIKSGLTRGWYADRAGEQFPVVSPHAHGWYVSRPDYSGEWTVFDDDAEPIYAEPEVRQEPVKHSQYKRTIRGVTVDVYDILHAWQVSNPATAHALKKLLRAGSDHNDRITDLEEAGDSIKRAVDLEKEGSK